MEPQDLQGRKTGMNLWKQWIQLKDLPAAVYTHWIMLSTSSVTQLWKRQNALGNLPLSVHYCLGWCGPTLGGTVCFSLGCPFGIQAEFAWNMFWCGSLPAWSKLLPQPSAWPGIVSYHAMKILYLEMEVVPRNTSWRSPKGFHCHLGECHYSSVVILSPRTNQVTQTKKWDAKW